MPKRNISTKHSVGRSARKTKRAVPDPARKRGKSRPAPKSSATREDSSPIFSKLKLRLDGPPGPRVSIGEALRQHGVDEHVVAENYVHVLGKLTAENPDSGGVQKLLVDLLKEFSRQIEASQPPARASADAPVIVQLVHSIARPTRALPPADS